LERVDYIDLVGMKIGNKSKPGIRGENNIYRGAAGVYIKGFGKRGHI
jgi:hypothetical protein